MGGERSNGVAEKPEKFVPQTWSQKEAHDKAVRAAAVVATDFPLLPTSHMDATPVIAEEPGDNLTPAQRLAVAALVSGDTFVSAARVAGVSRRTLYDWRQLPDFQRAVEGRSQEALGAAVMRIRNLVLRATRVLGESMLDRDRGGMHAFRVLNSNRIWKIAENAELVDEERKTASKGPKASDGR